MMAPALPDVAVKYHVTNPTVLALTLSVFLISFAAGVRTCLPHFPSTYPFPALVYRPTFRDVRPYLGQYIISAIPFPHVLTSSHTTQPLHIGNILTLGFSLGCAYAPTTGSFIAFRLLSKYQVSADPA